MRSCPFGKHVEIVNDAYGDGAYYVVHKRNNEHSIELTSEGDPSILFETLKYLYGEEKAFVIKAQIYFDDYRKTLDTKDFVNGEPRIHMDRAGDYYFKTVNGKRAVSDLRPTAPTKVSESFKKFRIAKSDFFTEDELAKIEYITNVPTFKERYKRIEEVSIAPWSAVTVTVNGNRAFNAFTVLQSSPERIAEMAEQLRGVKKVGDRLYVKKHIAPELQREFNSFRNSVNAVYPGMIDDSAVNEKGRVIKIRNVRFSVDESTLEDLFGHESTIERTYPGVFDAKQIEKKALAVWAANLRSKIDALNVAPENETKEEEKLRIIKRRALMQEIETLEKKIDTILDDLTNQSEGQAALIARLEKIAQEDLAELETADLSENMPAAALTYYSEKIALWSEMANMSRADHFALSPSDVDMYGERLAEIFKEFAPYNRQLERLKEKKVQNYVNKNLNKDLTKEEVFKAMKDSWLTSRLLSIDKIDHPLVKLLYIETKNANAQITREQTAFFKEYDQKLEAAMPKLKEYNEKDPFALLRQEQTDETGKSFYNGNMVHPYSASFLSTRDAKAAQIRNASTEKKRKAAQKRYYKWLDQNVTHFDYNLLFPLEGQTVSEDKKKAYLEELYRQGGKERVDMLLKYAERMANQYKTDHTCLILELHLLSTKALGTIHLNDTAGMYQIDTFL